MVLHKLVPIATLAIQVSSIILEQYFSVLRYFSFNQNAKKWWWLGELRQERDKDHDIA